jgi:hypothetical protein
MNRINKTNQFEHPAKAFSSCLNGKQEHRETRILQIANRLP